MRHSNYSYSQYGSRYRSRGHWPRSRGNPYFHHYQNAQHSAAYANPIQPEKQEDEHQKILPDEITDTTKIQEDIIKSQQNMLEETKSETCAQTEENSENNLIDAKSSEIVAELEKNKLAAHSHVKQISYLEQELQEERKKRIKAEEELYDLLFTNQQPNKKVDNSSLVCMAEGKPHYTSYAHLVENKGSINDLLDLVNEELRNKHILLRKIALKLGPISELSKEDRDELNRIVKGFP